MVDGILRPRVPVSFIIVHLRMLMHVQVLPSSPLHHATSVTLVRGPRLHRSHLLSSSPPSATSQADSLKTASSTPLHPPAMLQLNADAAVCTADVSSPTAYIQVSLVFPLHATSNMLVCAPTCLMRGPSKKPRLLKTTSST